MRRFTSILTTVMLPLALASCEGRKDAPPEAFGPHEVASPATKVTPPQADDTSAPHVAEHPATLPRITMHKDPNCECCSLWARHVEGAGFPVSVVADTHMDAFKRSVGVPAGKGSCHTAQVEGYFIEGHVPVEDIQRLLAERPDARGLAAPGMPIGSPGMPGPARPYTVYLIDKDGSSTPYSQHGH
jgi:hypothetical protein